jgi:hypothetical protein
VRLRHGHLDDEQLFGCYISVGHGEPLDPPAVEHLTDCEACGERYDEIARFMEILREEAATEADAVFTDERLHAQAREITRRIDHVGRVARVIDFPQRLARRTIMVPSAHVAPRWIAAAAAIGVFVGAVVGASYQAPWRYRAAARPSMASFQSGTGQESAALTATATGGRGPVPDVAVDEAFLSELETVDRPHSRELLPFDALTPHVREISDIH